MEQSEMGNLQIITSSVINEKLKELKKEEEKAGIELVRNYKHKEFLEKETWMEIMSCEGSYISSYGRVAKRLKDGTTNIIKPQAKSRSGDYIIRRKNKNIS